MMSGFDATCVASLLLGHFHLELGWHVLTIFPSCHYIIVNFGHGTEENYYEQQVRIQLKTMSVQMMIILCKQKCCCIVQLEPLLNRSTPHLLLVHSTELSYLEKGIVKLPVNVVWSDVDPAESSSTKNLLPGSAPRSAR